MNRILASNLLFFPVRFMRGEPIVSALSEVRMVEKYSKEEIDKYQIDRVNGLIHYSIENVPFYKRQYAGICRQDLPIRNYDDLLRLPVITKDTVKGNITDLISTEPMRVSKRTTSGSSGQPLIFYKDRRGSAFMDAVMYHTYSWHGIRIGDRQARFWGLPLHGKDKKLALLKDRLMNRIRLSSFDLRDQAMEKYYQRLRIFKPKYFYGYPSLIYEFACYLQRMKYSLEWLKLKGIILTGELIVPRQLAVIEETFRAPAINEYGCTEVGIIAFQCPNGSMHVMSHNIILEVLRDGKRVINDEGTVCVTELHGKGMPFIRYMLDDRAILRDKPCDCGIAFPVIEVRSGRVDDYILMPDGNKIYDAILAYTLKKGIKVFKARQTSLTNLEIYIVKEPEYSKELENKYFAALSEALGGKMAIRFNYVEEIPRDPSGKLRYFASDVNKHLD
jgi:phenylacetate-CoA ligase